jgi:hypothetical protein
VSWDNSLYLHVLFLFPSDSSASSQAKDQQLGFGELIFQRYSINFFWGKDGLEEGAKWRSAIV